MVSKVVSRTEMPDNDINCHLRVLPRVLNMRKMALLRSGVDAHASRMDRDCFHVI